MSIISQYKPQVDRDLEAFFTAKQIGKTGIESTVISALREFTMRGGKRVRPLFMIMGYWLNSDIDERIVRASTSLELMQSYLLIHDDIIDQSPTRRGGPSFHKLWNHEERVNEGIAIVAADLADAYSHEILLGNNFPPENLNNAMMTMSETVESTGIGQLMDITMPFKENVTLEDVTMVHIMKTAHYTINGPMKIGAQLAGYPRVDIIDHYGIPLGIAFQIQDDILGMYGDEKTLGKPITSDFEEGKLTHLILNAYRMAGKDEVNFIRKLLGKQGINSNDFGKVRKIIESSGALAKTKELALSYYSKAISAIDELTDVPIKKNELKEMAEKMVNRIS